MAVPADEAWLRRWVTRGVGRRQPVLDVGCGDGELAVLLAQRGIAVTAVDVDRARLRASGRAAAAAGLAGRITWRVEDAQGLASLPDRTFRAVSVIFVLHHLAEPGAGLHAAWRVLAPGGRLLVAELLPSDPGADECRRLAPSEWLTWFAHLQPAAVHVTTRRESDWMLAVLEK